MTTGNIMNSLVKGRLREPISYGERCSRQRGRAMFWTCGGRRIIMDFCSYAPCSDIERRDYRVLTNEKWFHQSCPPWFS